MIHIRNENLLKILGKRIRQLRTERNLTQEQLAAKIDNHGEQIGRVERGELNVSISTLYLVATGLEISLKELFDFKIEEK